MRKVAALLLVAGTVTAQKVGVGITSPQAYLHVKAPDTFIEPVIQVEKGSSPYLIITSDGRVGIFTPLPSHNLHVKGSIRFENLADSMGAIMITDSLGVVSIIPFSSDTTKFLSGDGVWRQISFGGDNWGTQVAEADTPIIGNGTVANPIRLISPPTAQVFLFWNGSVWTFLPFDSIKFWSTMGNIASPSNILGTLNPVALKLVVDSQTVMVLDTNGSIRHTQMGGNRGTASVDWQFFIDSTGGALADTSVIGGGAFNTIYDSAFVSFIGSGVRNTVATSNSAILSGSNNTILKYAGDTLSQFNAIASGKNNKIDSLTYFSFIHSGHDNLIKHAPYSHIIGGQGDTIIGYGQGYAFIGVGDSLVIFTSEYSSIVGGLQNSVFRSEFSIIGGGRSNSILEIVPGAPRGSNVLAGGENNLLYYSALSTIAGGILNEIRGNFGSFIGAGQGNYIYALTGTPGLYNVIVSGYGDSILRGHYSVIVSGSRNKIGGTSGSHFYNFIGSGVNNQVRGSFGVIVSGSNNTVLGLGFVGTGIYNWITGRGVVIISGDTNSVFNDYSVIGSGQRNSISTSHSFIATGTDDTIGGNYSSIITGITNYVQGDFSFVGTGLYNKALLDYGVIVSGDSNSLESPYSFMGIGRQNYISNTTGFNFIGSGLQDTIRGSFNVMTGGRENLISGTYSLIGTGTSNRVLYYYSGIITGNDNLVFSPRSIIGSGSQNSISNSFGYNFIASGLGDTITGRYSGIISGYSNVVRSSYGFIGTGNNNAVNGTQGAIIVGSGNTISTTSSYSFISSGISNTILGDYSAIIGGFGNTIGISSRYSVISGGGNNYINGNYCATIGGRYDTVIGWYSVALGGYNNFVQASYSVAAGQNARVTGDNSFVWSDGTNVTSSVSKQFIVYATNGVGINTTGPIAALDVSYASSFTKPQISLSSTTVDGFARLRFTSLRSSGDYRLWDIAAAGFDSTLRFYAFGVGSNVVIFSGVGNRIRADNGAYLSAGGVWTNASSRTYKNRIKLINKDSILEKILLVPVYSWYYINSNERHIGPLSEDFHKVFPVGDMTDPSRTKSLSALDVAGVSLAATQQLYLLVKQLKAENEDLRNKYEALYRELQEIKAKMQLQENPSISSAK